MNDEEKERKRLYNKEYREKNKDRIKSIEKNRDKEKRKISAKRYADKKKEELKEYRKKYKIDNILKIKEYYEKNKEELLKKSKKYQEENKDILSDKKKEYYERNKESRKEYYENEYKERRKKLIEDDREKYSEKSKKYYEENIEKKKEYRENNKEKAKQYRIDNKDKIRLYRIEYLKHKISTDNLFRIKRKIRIIVNRSIKGKGLSKKYKTEDIVGCSFEELLLHIEKQFEPWMNWSNYGKCNGEYNFGWDIDHIIELKTSKTEEDVLKLNHYSNLRPLDSQINRVDRNKKV